MIEELVLVVIGSVLAGQDRFTWEEVIGVTLGSGFVVVVLLMIGQFMPGQGQSLNCFMRLMLFGYVPMRVFTWVEGTFVHK